MTVQQVETQVADLKAGQWVYIYDRLGWFELLTDAGKPYSAPVPGSGGNGLEGLRPARLRNARPDHVPG